MTSTITVNAEAFVGIVFCMGCVFGGLIAHWFVSPWFLGVMERRRDRRAERRLREYHGEWRR